MADPLDVVAAEVGLVEGGRVVNVLEAATAAAEGSALPPPTDMPQVRRASLEAEGVQLEIAVLDFEDKYYVIVSERGRFGTVIDCCVEEAAERVYGARVLLGDRSKQFYLAYARAIMQLVAEAGSAKSVILQISVRSDSQALYKAVMAHLRETFVF